MLKGSETRNLSITNVISFESNLMYNNCNCVLPQIGFTVLPGRAVKYYSVPKQASTPIPYGDRVSYHIKLYII